MHEGAIIVLVLIGAFAFWLFWVLTGPKRREAKKFAKMPHEGPISVNPKSEVRDWGKFRHRLYIDFKISQADYALASQMGVHGHQLFIYPDLCLRTR